MGSLFTVNLGNAGDNEVEARVLAWVGSYGRQIGQIGDAVGVLIEMVEAIDKTARANLSDDRKAMLKKLEDQLAQVKGIKDERERGQRMGTDGTSEDGVKMVPPTAVTTTMPASATVS